MIQSLQILRAFAALAVVYKHYNPSLNTGGYGVDVFFVISGFIISYVINRSTKKFMIKRIIRIVPLYYLATLVTIALFFIMPQKFNNVIINPEATIKSFLFIPYRIQNSGPILSLGWTLIFELFFYLTMYFSIKLNTSKKNINKTCAVIVASFLLIIALTDTDNQIIKFFNNGMIMLEFLYGMGLYYLWDHTSSKKININILFFLGTLSFIYLTYSDIYNYKPFVRGINRGIPAFFITASFLYSEYRINKENKIIRFLVRLGDASFVLYLFHTFPLFFMNRIVFPEIFGKVHHWSYVFIKIPIIIVLISSISFLINDYFDKPLNRFLNKRIQK